MRNIIRIFLSDVKRLSSNVVANVVIIGLSVIPCLYAWFNILSNWAPYEAASTQNLSVAVANVDDGMTLAGVELNIGEIIVENLQSNDSINWIFLDNSYEAVEGVRAGDYYAALVIDEKFSEDMLSFLGGNIEHPEIIYYENEKKNAIAPKITGKVKTTVQEEVNRAFVGTLAKGALSASGYLEGADGESSATDVALKKLRTMDNDLTTAIAILDSYISLIDTAENLMDAAEAVMDELDLMMDSAQAMMGGAQAATNAAGTSIEAASDLVTVSLNQITTQMNTLNDTLNMFITEAGYASNLTESQVSVLQDLATAMQAYFDTATNGIDYNEEIDQNIATVDADFAALQTDLDKLNEAAQLTDADVQRIYDDISGDVKKSNNDMNSLIDTYTYAVRPQLRSTMTSVQNSLIEVEGLVNYSGNSINDLAAILQSYPDMISLGTDRLESSRDEVAEMQEKLRDLIYDLENLDQNEQYAMLVRLLETDPDQIADFVSEPIGLDTEAIYPVENNGSAMAPFYIVLSIWVGSLILVAIMHTKVKPIEGVKNMRTYEEFFGRYITFYLIGQLQTVITVTGALLYVGIQCEHPFLLWFAMSVTSFTYTLLLFALTYAFDAVGEAIAVVLMVVQVAGSGGSFPVEVLPDAFRYLYPAMPFAYSMNAARECIAGTYQNDYWMYLSGLLVFIGFALFVGLVISIPCKRLNKFIKRSTEKTDLMI